MTEIPPDLIQNGVLAADVVAMQEYATESKRTRAIVTRALEALAANGQIQVVPQEQWPDWFVLEPPYRLPFRRSLAACSGA